MLLKMRLSGFGLVGQGSKRRFRVNLDAAGFCLTLDRIADRRESGGVETDNAACPFAALDLGDTLAKGKLRFAHGFLFVCLHPRSARTPHLGQGSRLT